MNWQPAETAPKDGRQIVGRNNRGNYAVLLWQDGWVVMFSDGRVHPFWNGGCGSVMTHWCEIDPPEVQERRGGGEDEQDG